MSHDVFLQEICQHPDDINARLVYADWLEDVGDPRGEFIRIQCELATLSDEDDEQLDRKAELAYRQRDLLEEFGAQWDADIRPFADHWQHRCGFVEYVELTFQAFVKHGEALFGKHPITAATLRGAASAHIAALAASPWLGRLTRLCLDGCALEDDDLQTLCKSTQLAQLTRLTLSHNRLGDAGVRALAACPALAQLEILDLSENQIRNAGVQALAESPHLANLQALVLSSNQIRLTGARALAASETLTGLEYLDLSQNLLDMRAVEALRERFGRDVCRA